MVSRWMTLLLWCMLPLLGIAQSDKYVAKIEVSNNAPSLNEKVEINLKLLFKGNNLSLSNPRFAINKGNLEEHFTILSQQESRRGFFDFNMGSDGITVFDYVFIVKAKKKGKVTLSPLQVFFNDKPYATKALTFHIGEAPPASSLTGQGDIFITTLVSKSKLYINEPLLVRYKLYSKYSINDLNEFELPSYAGFLSYNLDKRTQFTLKEEVVNGQRYFVIDLGKQLLYPQRAGQQVLDPMEVSLVVAMPTGRYQRDFFNRRIQVHAKKEVPVKSSQKSLHIKALPPAPANFSGLVGKFTIDSKITKEQVAVNDAVNLYVSVQGTGNLKTLNAFDLQLNDNFEAYEPKTNDKININAGGMSGSRKFDYLIIARHPGNYAIPSIPFVFFDPAKGQYVSASTPEYNIQVGKGSGDDNSGVLSTTAPISKETVGLIGKDIRFIHSDVSLKRKNDFFLGSPAFYVSMSAPALLLALLAVVRRQRLNEQRDVATMRQKGANKLANKHLKQAKTKLEANETVAFYEEIFKALYGYLSDRLRIPVSQLNKENIQSALQQQGIDNTHVELLTSVLNTCEMARFAPVSDMQPQTIYDQSASVIQSIEKHLS